MTKSAVAFWVAQYNAVASTLATRTSERDSARNGLYVSGVYGSGQTWQAKDATDLANYNAEVSAYNTSQANLATMTANYNAEVAAYNAALAPASVVHIGSAHNSAQADGIYHNPVDSITLDRSGQWLVFWAGIGGNMGMDGYLGGGLVMQVSGQANSGSLGGMWQGFASAGSVVTSAINASGGGTRFATIDAYFIPTQGNPH